MTTRCANFGIVEDDIALEETETFRVVYSIVSPPGAMRGPISEAWVNIADNDRHGKKEYTHIHPCYCKKVSDSMIYCLL